jgi:hypothetical protein
VAASSTWTDPDGIRRPAGEVHAWIPGTNQTLCGLPLHRSQLGRHPYVDWEDILPESGRHADAVRRVCPRCDAATRRPRRPRRRDDRGRAPAASALSGAREPPLRLVQNAAPRGASAPPTPGTTGVAAPPLPFSGGCAAASYAVDDRSMR